MSLDNEQYPLVSVALITYNQKSFLKECIESILSQSYENIEIIVADDGSVDGTQEMLEDYSKRNPNKFVLRLSLINKGITINSNAAHFACNGKYIAWMGGDDLMLPGKIIKQVRYMESHPDCTICYHDLDVFNSDSNGHLYNFSKKSKPRSGDIRTSIKHGVFNGACSTMVRTDRTPEHGYDERIPVASDWLYWVESLGNGGTIDYINEVLGRYRRHDNNITNDKMTIEQNTIDHLNSCNYLHSKYPEFFKEIIYRYVVIIRSNRHKLPYLNSLFFSLKNNLDVKSLISITVYLSTLSKIKL